MESIMLRFTDNISTSEIAYYYSYLRCDCNNRSGNYFIHCDTYWKHLVEFRKYNVIY